jgi:DNA-binding beta-propeller fold protein YncE
MYYNNLIYIAWYDGLGNPGKVSVYDLTGAHQFDFSGGTAPGLLGGMAVDSLGNVYVLDYVYTFVRYYNGSTGVYIDKFAYLNNTGYFINSGGIAIDPITGNLYIVDANGGLHFVQVWSPYPGTPTHLFDFGTSVLNSPFDIAIDSKGLVHVADFGKSTIQVFDLLGVFRYKYGSQGTGPGQFLGPWNIIIDSSDNIYVTDNNGSRIEKFGYNDLVFQEI